MLACQQPPKVESIVLFLFHDFCRFVLLDVCDLFIPQLGNYKKRNF
jgi:hypothetical protein